MACAVWCLCQTLRDLVLQPNLFIQNADCSKRAERLYRVVDSAIEEKLSSHRCSMTSSRECYSLLVTQWHVKRLYLAVSDIYKFSKGCATLLKMKNTTNLLENQNKNFFSIPSNSVHSIYKWYSPSSPSVASSSLSRALHPFNVDSVDIDDP